MSRPNLQARDDFPLIADLPASFDLVEAFRRVSRQPKSLFLDSALRRGELGRWSFLACDPARWFEIPRDASDPLAEPKRLLDAFAARRRPDLPPFVGGLAGLLSYELGRSYERLPRPEFEEFNFPAATLGWYDVVVAHDAATGRACVLSQGLDAEDESRRRRTAEDRLRWMMHLLESPPAPGDGSASTQVDLLAPTRATPLGGSVVSNFSQQEYLDAVAACVEYVRAGDVFQVNLSQRLALPAIGDWRDDYLHLRRANPATFAGCFDAGGFQVLSASPERFLQVVEGAVETRPIKGTRPRRQRPEADLFAADDLLSSEKDRAENVMIVDLLRNDLSRVCRGESVVVPQLCALESYAHVQHLVSTVAGRLRADCSSADLIAATFPGGSVTGAPKIRSMEIITELERVERGPYCGSLGYLGCDGSVDLNILIRTVTRCGGWRLSPVGGGITARSDPAKEYAETWHKAEGLLPDALTGRER